MTAAAKFVGSGSHIVAASGLLENAGEKQGVHFFLGLGFWKIV